MSRTRSRLRPFHVEHLAALPPTCRDCPLGDGVATGFDPDGSVASWVRASEAEWGQAGVASWHGDRIIGFLLLSTPLHVPRTGPQSGVAFHRDSAIVMTLRVLDEYARAGTGWQLVQAAAACVAKGPRTFHALETEAIRGRASCALPSAEFLESAGFEVCREHPVRPRLRLDLSRTVRWKPDLAKTADRLTAWVRPLPPEPASRSSDVG
ncbi:hypothetical protein [Mariniluteicoccus flavus]